MQPNWINEMDEAATESKFVTFEDGTTVLDILSDPAKCKSKFTWPDGSPKTEFRMDVRREGSVDVKVWGTTSKDVMGQIVGIVKKYGLPSLVGCKISVGVRTLPGKKAREWFLQLVGMPGAIGQVQSVPVQSVQTAPVQTMPTVPAQSIPTAPVQAMPTVPAQSIPTAPAQSVPTAPAGIPAPGPA